MIQYILNMLNENYMLMMDSACILYFISFQVMSKTIFTKTYNFARVAPSLKSLKNVIGKLFDV